MTPTRRLIDISNDCYEFKQLVDGIDDLDTLSQEDQQRLEAFAEDLATERDKKLDSIGAYVKDLKARSTSRKAIAEQMSALAKSDENKAKYLSSMLLTFFQIHDLKTVNTLRCRLTRSANGGKEPIVFEEVDPSTVPEDFQKVTVAFDSERVREELEAGGELPFARLIPRSEHMRIG